MQLLVGLALALLVAVAAVELQGLLTLVRALREDARTTAQAVAAVLVTSGSDLATVEGGETPHPIVSWAVIADGRVVHRVGAPGPTEPAWWPWDSRSAWEEAGTTVKGPLPFLGGQVLVVRRILADERILRVVVQVPSTVLAARWQWYGGILGLVVAAGGGLLAWFLVGRLLSPYQELLSQAGRVSRPGAGQAEDRFLIETFRETVERLQRSEASLRERADDLEVLADVLTREATAGVLVSDGEGRVRAANQAAEELLASDRLVGQPIPGALAGAGPRVVLGDRVLEVGRFPLRSAAGTPLGEVVFVEDRTPVEALERALQEREHMATLGELSAGMAHEVRNALSTIRGYLWLLPQAGEEDRERYLQAVAAESQVVGEVLDRFLAFSQPQALHREVVPLNELVQEVTRRLAASAAAVTVHLVTPPVQVSGDRLALTVVVENLLRNALDAATAEGGEVWVMVEAVTGGARVVVEDNGCGVSADIRPRLFQPFATTKPSGGLGLALARRFARLHGGDVLLVERAGGGSRFEVHLPQETSP